MQTSTVPIPFPVPVARASASIVTGDVDLEPDICWQAMHSRDRRFDGRFFVAAVTTGIYCRSICPVPFAKPNNIALFPCAAAAEAAGYRPCRRCHPESSPGTPAWLGTSAVVSRALRLIWEGALDGNSVDELAERVGIGSRQLRRLFIQHLGVPPIKIASTHRVHFARNLIEQTDMPMAEIALNSGFNSLRQFNHAVRTIAGQAPTDLRHLRDNSAVSSLRGEFVMRLLYRPPFNWPALVAFLRPRATPGVELVEDNSYQRTVESDGGAGVIDVRPDQENACLIVRIALPKYRGLLRVVERVRRVFDLPADPLQIAGHLSHDPRLKPLLDDQPGLRVPGAWDGFEVAIRAALGQRLTVVDSNAVAAELVRKFGRPIETSVAGLSHLFPRPEDLAGAELAPLGIARKCAASITALARALCNQEFTFESARTLQETISRLRAIEGVGEEMAHYIAMRAFGEPDAFPLDYRTLRRAMGKAEIRASAEQLRSFAEEWRADEWRPWRAYAAMHLWLAFYDAHS
jgi:AraC family transcriptional regulator, regulatory protein of adaptative response / DNA-3-methyladenine glycosylase II